MNKIYYNSWCSLVASIMVIYFLVKIIVIRLWWRPRMIEQHFSKQGIRGPSYHFFIGNAKEIGSLMFKASSMPFPPFSHNILPRVLSFYHHWKKIYGATFVVWFGSTVRLTVADPELIREILCSKSELYEKIQAHPLIKQVEGEGLLSLNGDKWAHHRKIITPTFHMDNLKLLIPAVSSSVMEKLENWLPELSTSAEVEIEVSKWYQALTEKIVTRTTFGSSNKEGTAIFKLQAQQTALASQAFHKVFIPGYRFLPTKRNMKSWKLDKKIKKSLVGVIESRRANWKDEMLENGPRDLLGLMIQASIKEEKQSYYSPASSPITVHDIVEECKSFFFAGEQTTSNLLTWTTILLAMHPEWQVMARDEVLEVCGSRDPPTKDNVSKLKMLGMILNETLRLYPPVVATIRRAKIDLELGSCKVPRGTELLIPILAVHHDRAIWGNDANEFNPGRFLNGVARAANHPVAFMPFSVGVRTCIGQNLATLQAKLTLAIILQKFTFRLSPQYQHAPTVLMLLYPQYGAPIIFQHLAQSGIPHNQESLEIPTMCIY
ncbi:Cytokinin trans-hydroxylase [Heracleum sosnowskyi]|uniref:Cytokinin trans-hydroxylase n=1 Tax=Heracleum sosnowskyi TaxID=360622 RepID=A0AAD8JI34_9APIA|nr:Cytokinin trans-hydroxylase [Heracleum sosnowskyi]